MSWDIYGNPLRRGYCEVHPDVHQEYPCSICMAQKQQQSQPHNELEQLQYEFAQQGDYIRHLESERAALSTQVESLLDDRKAFVKKEFQLLKEIERLEIELKKRDEQNAALAAQVEALNSKNFELTCYRVDVLRCLKTIAFEHNHADVPLYQPMARQLMDSISANAELKEVRAKAGRDGYLQGHLDAAGDDVGEWSRKHSEYHAKQYADSIRQGGAA